MIQNILFFVASCVIFYLAIGAFFAFHILRNFRQEFAHAPGINFVLLTISWIGLMLNALEDVATFREQRDQYKEFYLDYQDLVNQCVYCRNKLFTRRQVKAKSEKSVVSNSTSHDRATPKELTQ